MSRSRDPITEARQLRIATTPAERKLWSHLRDGRMMELHFRRQHPIGRYIVDFYCDEAKLVIEVDGSQHMENESDSERDRWLATRGIVVMRLWNNQVVPDPTSALEAIRLRCVAIIGER